MAKNRLFENEPTTRLIISVEESTVRRIDGLIRYPHGNEHPAKGNRSEFVRLAIEEKLAREARN
ncbi:hypothetical protein D3C84_1042980 [compost metagenome]